MWYWIALAASLYILFILLEESVYLLWNRYVYGPKERKTKMWKRHLLGIVFLTRLHLREIRQKHLHKVRSDKQSA